MAAIGELPSLLLVDDEPTNIQVLSEALRGDFSVYFALDGERALRAVRDHHVDLVLLDVVLPGMDGFEVLQRLKADSATRDIPVIFVTSRDDAEDETRGLAMGAVDYVSKPFRPAVVRARINTHLALKRQRELLAKHALIDGLTEIGNRRQFDNALAQRWRAQMRAKTPVGLVMLDIDHFKDYNDNYGHAFGDRCLKAVAACLASSFSRAEDVVTRFGGEEFAVIVNAEQGDSFRHHLQGLLEAVNRLDIRHDFSKTASHLTVSGGAIRTRAEAGASPRDLVQAADELLYRAKNEGRNRLWYRDVLSGSDECLMPAPG